MKHTIILIITVALLGFASCEQPKPIEEDTELEHKTEETIHAITNGDVEILEIDGCQYIVYKELDGPNRGYGYMAHKGNCSNPIHCYQSQDTDTP